MMKMISLVEDSAVVSEEADSLLSNQAASEWAEAWAEWENQFLNRQ